MRLSIYVLKRIAFLIVSLFVSTVSLFFLLRVLPGDPENSLISVGMTKEQIAQIRSNLNLNRPLIDQFLSWIWNLLHFHLGESFSSGTPIAPELIQRIQITIPLSVISFAFSLPIALFLGYSSAKTRKNFFSKIANVISVLGLSVPIFWVGIFLVFLFSIRFNVFQSGGFPTRGWHDPIGSIKSLTLPILTITIVMSASLSRHFKKAISIFLNSELNIFAKSLGLSEKRSYIRHGLRNSFVALTTVFGIELATSFVGAVIVEAVFDLPGLGSYLIKAIEQHDYPAIQASLLLSSTLVLFCGLIADSLQRLLDPRILNAK